MVMLYDCLHFVLFFQVDIAPTLALLFGVPIPKNNVGMMIAEASFFVRKLCSSSRLFFCSMLCYMNSDTCFGCSMHISRIHPFSMVQNALKWPDILLLIVPL